MMTTWTNEQVRAITEEGQNILISAGAGSGKTAVLTERVIRKIRSGQSIENLLVLTFTKAAAFEMKERIKNALSKEGELADQLALVDSSYITNFDSFSSSIVKKYYYLLDISKDFSIINQTVLDYQSTKILDDIFEELYEQEDEDFLNLIANFCVKSDKNVKKEIMRIASKLDLKIDKETYLNNYFDNYFSENKLAEDFKLYENLIILWQNKIKEELHNLSHYADEDYYQKVNDGVTDILKGSTYDELVNISFKIPNLPNGSSDELKETKASLKESCDSFKKLFVSSSKADALSEALMSKTTIKVIVSVALELAKRIEKFKQEHARYTFTDIAKMSIKLLQTNPDVRLNMQNSFNEIMVDEYQDTSDLQEELINLIARDNLYMVGDIKQSIYQFRNANPNLFKTKYENYSLNKGGIKIDLQKNFRSREEVISNINEVFLNVMTDAKGGIDYSKDQAMIFGNKSYENEAISDRNMKVINLQFDSDNPVDPVDSEIFAMLRDIQNKIKNNYQVIDKKSGKLRAVSPKDFAILIDRSKHFDRIKKIFEHEGIATAKYTSTKILDYDEIYLIKNILTLINCLETKDFATTFRYAYTSVARSYLFQKSDEEIFDNLNSKGIYETDVIIKVKELQKDLALLTVEGLIQRIYKDFNFVNLIPLTTEIEPALLRLDFLTDIARECDALKKDYTYLINLIEVAIEYDFKMEVANEVLASDSVTVRTLHGSKGLEYPICYFPFLSSRFNTDEIKQKFLYHENLGIISPFEKNGLRKSFYHKLFETDFYQSAISEEIRLFYVALTRAKEEINLITKFDMEKTYSEKTRPNSFQDLLAGVYDGLTKYMRQVDVNALAINRDYNKINKTNYVETLNRVDKLSFEDYFLDNEITGEETFSKTSYIPITKEEEKNIELGNRLHYILEVIDFKNPDLSRLDEQAQRVAKNFLDLDLKLEQADIYQEYEFITSDKETIRHGVIDLLLVYDQHVIIIDYKLSNTSDPAYLKQLDGYAGYISNKLGKPVQTYLYSLLSNDLVKVL